MENEPPPEYPGKYACIRDELLDVIQNMGWANESSGDVECATGHFARISNGTDEVGELVDALPDEYQVAGREHYRGLVGHFLVVTDSLGFVTVTEFTSEPDLLAAYQELEAEYSLWEGQDE